MYTFTFDVYRIHLGHTATTRTSLIWSGTGLMTSCLEALVKKSRSAPLPSGRISYVRRALKGLSPTTITLLKQPAQAFDHQSLLGLINAIFTDLEANESSSLSARQQLFSSLAQVLCHSSPALLRGNYAQWIEGILPSFRRVNRVKNFEALDRISEEPYLHLITDPSRGAEVLKESQSHIESACTQELHEYLSLVEIQDSLLSAKNIDAKQDVDVTETASSELAYIASLREFRLLADSHLPLPCPPTWKDLEGRTDQNPRAHPNPLPWLLAKYRLTNAALLAAFVLVSLRTGWNPQSVAALARSGISRPANGDVILQSYKSKTDDYTPPVRLLRSDTAGQLAIRLLERNLNGAILLGHVPDNEERLFLGWSKRHVVRPLNADGSILRSFIKKHSLKRFRLKDMRPLKAAIAYLTYGDIEHVRLILGHQSLSTVDTYLRSTLLFKINESNILQFQRNIEAALTTSPISETKLASTGDGGSCSDPSLHRLGKVSIPCDGLPCHVGTTCPNYVMAPSKQSTDDAIRTLDFYRANWNSLAQDQPEKLRDIHIPRAIYIRVFIKVISDSRPDLLPEGFMI